MGVLCTWVKLLTDLQILGCELHKKMRLAAGLALTRWVAIGFSQTSLDICPGLPGCQLRHCLCPATNYADNVALPAFAAAAAAIDQYLWSAGPTAANLQQRPNGTDRETDAGGR